MPSSKTSPQGSYERCQTLNYSAPAFNSTHQSPSSSHNSSSALGSSMFEDHKFDGALSSHSGSSFKSDITQDISVGLCGLAGKPRISMSESEAWIMDPRTPIKKFAALLFKLANVRKQIFKQLQKEFKQVSPIGKQQQHTPDSGKVKKTKTSILLQDDSE